MKKHKILLIIFSIISIIIFIFILNAIRNYIIITKLVETAKNYTTSLNNYHLTSIESSPSSMYFSIHEQFYKDNIFLNKSLINNGSTQVIHYENKNTNEKIEFDVNTSETNFDFDFSLKPSYTYLGDWNNSFLFTFIIKKGDYYIFNIYSPFSVCKHIVTLNINTGLIEKEDILFNENNAIFSTTYILENDVVTDDNIKKPM